MVGSLTDKITDVRNAARPTSARATGTRSAGGTSLACDDLTGWPTSATSKVHFVTYQIDSNSNPVAGTQLDCRGIVSGNTIGSFAVLDGNDTGNSIGDVVEMLPTASWAQDLADALLAQHTRTGGHQGITTDTIVVSSGTSLPAGDIGTADLAAGAVTTAKLADASVTPDKLNTGATASDVVATETTTSTSYVALATPQSITIIVGGKGLVLFTMTVEQANSTANFNVSTYVMSGANITAATDDNGVSNNGINNASTHTRTKLLTGLNPGSTTFTLQHRVTGGTGTFTRRHVAAIPL